MSQLPSSKSPSPRPAIPLPPPPRTKRNLSPNLPPTVRSQRSSAPGSQGIQSPPTAATPAAEHRAAPPPIEEPTEGQGDGPTLEQIVRKAFDEGYSDIHVGVGEVPRYRNRGEISITDFPVATPGMFESWLTEILTPEQIEEFKETLDFDGAAQYDFSRVRINIFDSLKGPSIVMRLIPVEILTIKQLNLPSIIRDICHYHKGLVLVTGPTGSGKSTTMAAMIDYINKEMPKHIITIEDPVEFVHQSQKSLIKQREVGVHTREFGNALKASLREDPDIILVGEMRDRETIEIALKAAQTGHLVFGTLHTNSAVKTVERILGMYEPEQQAPIRVAIAESLVGVIAQGLCRTTDGKRAAFHEILINTDAIKDYILRGQLDEVEAILPNCTFDGMCTMNQSLYALYEAERITEETALELSPKQNEMAQMLRGRI
ncbi:twitching motility protein [Synechococcus sp. PCC 7335]|uniref:type IV pilus twitching motility protein PilT n=1 Tax=Synechococcus sp. (strain ATCC 29403 / PCC 7335) TaxID=91464 RepID=UPI00017EE7A7|nr:type IV pilus twitching motility protein PilT [Synechococcus sp. PCC 7335]EDX84799.1 twitching motility protein [Synechococcus sp. PCC 7335]